MNEVSREINRAGRNRDERGRRQGSDGPQALAQHQGKSNGRDAKSGSDKSYVEGGQPVRVEKAFSSEEPGEPGDDRREIIKRWAVIVFGVIDIAAVVNQRD